MSARITTLSLSLALACATRPSPEPEPIEPRSEPVVFVEAAPGSTATQPAGVVEQPSEAERERARQLFMEGMLAYESGDYASALASFRQAYVLAPLPQLLFNIAHCHEQLGDSLAACNVYLQLEADQSADQGTRQGATDRALKLGCY